ncbi:hypothetical protein PV797_07795 [Clostridiaceae bacterium M8S5]|nr:hypothetical protein PV797_07795 [Clostridiaceae bacterium M8S5]
MIKKIITITVLILLVFNTMNVKATVEPDTDHDGILDKFEKNEYTIKWLKTPGEDGKPYKFEIWDDSKHSEPKFTKYKTSYLKRSTDDDPYSDLQEITGRGMDPSVTSEAQHPLVAAYPDITVNLEKFVISKNNSFTVGNGGANDISVTNENSNSKTDSLNWHVDTTLSVGYSAEQGVNGSVSVSAGVGGNNSKTVSYSKAHSSSTSKNWSKSLGLNTAEAAYVTFNIRYQNVGTAPIHNVKPTSTMVLDNTALYTLQAKDGLVAVQMDPNAYYPATGLAPLAMGQKDNFNSVPISININQLNKLQNNGEFQIQTPQFTGNIETFDEEGTPISTTEAWSEYIDLIKDNTAEIVIDSQELGVVKRNIAAKKEGNAVENSKPEITLREALKIAFKTTTDANNNIFYNNKKLNDNNNILIMMDQPTIDIFKRQTSASKSMWDVDLRAGMKIRFEVIASNNPANPNEELLPSFERVVYEKGKGLQVRVVRPRYTKPVDKVELYNSAINQPKVEGNLLTIVPYLDNKVELFPVTDEKGMGYYGNPKKAYLAYGTTGYTDTKTRVQVSYKIGNTAKTITKYITPIGDPSKYDTLIGKSNYGSWTTVKPNTEYYFSDIIQRYSGNVTIRFANKNGIYKTGKTINVKNTISDKYIYITNFFTDPDTTSISVVANPAVIPAKGTKPYIELNRVGTPSNIIEFEYSNNSQ